MNTFSSETPHRKTSSLKLPYLYAISAGGHWDIPSVQESFWDIKKITSEKFTFLIAGRIYISESRTQSQYRSSFKMCIKQGRCLRDDVNFAIGQPWLMSSAWPVGYEYDICNKYLPEVGFYE